VRGAVFESSEAKRWLLGGYDHGYRGGLSHAAATELAFAFRFTAERLHELGWINRVVEADQLMPTAREMATHLLTLPPACRVNTLIMMRAMRAKVPDNLERLATRLRDHGAKSDLMESRKAFVEKRRPIFKGWDNPQDRYSTPHLEE
jgi:enoyl-CoA hydratase/carnithine racemase